MSTQIQTDLRELSEIHTELLDRGIPGEENVYNRIIQEFDIDTQFSISQVNPDYDLTNEEKRVLEKAPHTNVPLQRVPDLLDRASNDPSWKELAEEWVESESVEYLWYGIDYGNINGETKGYISVNARFPTSSDVLPYLVNQAVTSVEMPYDEDAPRLNNDPWQLYGQRGQVGDVIRELEEALDTLSPNQTIGVSPEGKVEGFVENEDIRQTIAGSVDFCLGEPTVAELKRVLEKVASDHEYQEYQNWAASHGLKQSISHVKHGGDDYDITISFSEVVDNNFHSSALTNKPLP